MCPLSLPPPTLPGRTARPPCLPQPRCCSSNWGDVGGSQGGRAQRRKDVGRASGRGGERGVAPALLSPRPRLGAPNAGPGHSLALSTYLPSLPSVVPSSVEGAARGRVVAISCERKAARGRRHAAGGDQSHAGERREKQPRTRPRGRVSGCGGRAVRCPAEKRGAFAFSLPGCCCCVVLFANASVLCRSAVTLSLSC